MKAEHLFVYGTLRRDAGAAHAGLMREHFRLLGEATVQGRLYDIGGYPGLVPSPDPADRVRGELHELSGDPAALALLDDYEECSPRFPAPHEYQRLPLPVLFEGKVVPAWVYVYARPVGAGERIPDGDYAAFSARRA